MSLNPNKLDKLHGRYPERRAVITGAGSGLGKALAIELSKHGWTLFLNDIDNNSLICIEEECNYIQKSDDINRAQIHSYCFDVSDYELFSKAATDFLNKVNGVDMVFTCAGIGVGGSFLETKKEHIKEVFNKNVLGTIWAGKVFLPSMKLNHKGHFITIASAAAFHALPHLSVYSGSKAAVVQISEALRSELKPFDIDVTTKMTTFYTSNIADQTRGPKKEQEKARKLVSMASWSASQVADELILCVQRKKFYMVAPNQAKILWLFKRLLPEIYLRLMPKINAKIQKKIQNH
jgi:short-subunit dehydrogenase